jgi:uncharacterized protein (DUF983 family)
MSNDDFPRQSPVATGLAGRCPRCGKGAMFDGYIALPARCPACGLDYGFVDSGDGPAVFVMLIAGFVVVGAALIFDFKYEPPIWVHAVVTLPLAALVCLAMLRLVKGVLIALQYVNKAEPGRLSQ